ncbi:replicative DNA helicase loader DnaI [Bacillus oleivorans]|uniref:Replicative DNA helicase loader DnaI n=1 Tax=Bacillus oleivorans TaxID=1448271 RepID=A0A285CV50_9BACI|nr:primosomal protein DnaI [Bacillus oleivorans]SNX71451.1 replicative DNA helicase loader DnaI [Bacillus oleivorans]
MEKITNALSQWGKGSSFEQRYEQMKQNVLNHPDVRYFLNEHSSQITMEMVERNLNTLYEFSTQSKNCSGCPSLRECKNVMGGFHPRLALIGDHIEILYDQCPRMKLEQDRLNREKLVQSFSVPKEILSAKFESIDLNQNDRLPAIRSAKNFTQSFLENQSCKGLYLYGKFGVGKTYLLGAIANELAEKGVSSYIVHVPELIRELKNSIGESTLEEKLNSVKTAKILMLDDIGAESLTNWVRDEIFGTILQYRMLEKLPTLFTSNFDLIQLEHHFTFNQKGDQEDVKAGRLIDRIRALADPIPVGGHNRRG